MGSLTPTFRLVTPPASGRSAAIGVIHLGGDAEELVSRLKLGPLGPGQVRLRDFGGADRGVAARPSDRTLLLMPHAGPAVIRGVLAWLTGAGLREAAEADAGAMYPEAETDLEAAMLVTLAGAASPLAVDLLLDQPRRWRELGVADRAQAQALPPEVLGPIRARSRVLARLLRPPTVVCLGPPNIGKSTLLNTLARRSVSIVADEPGTTRDHVGAMLELAGLVVAFFDAPGIDHACEPGSPDAQAMALALHAAAGADLVIHAADADGAFLAEADQFPGLRARLRADRRPQPLRENAALSAHTGEGMDEFVRRVRDELVSPPVLADPGAWMFWRARSR